MSKRKGPQLSDFISVGAGGRRRAPTTADGRDLSRKERADIMREWRKDNPWYWRKMVSARDPARPGREGGERGRS